MTVGTHAIAGAYGGDGNFTTSTGTLSQVVAAGSTTTTVGATPVSPSGLGVGVTYTVTVSAGNGVTAFPTGSVAVTDGGGAITGCSAAPLTATATPGVSTATCAESGTSMTGGSHVIGATYGGDGNFPGSTSAVGSFTVNQAATTTAVSLSPTSATYGNLAAVTFTVR